MAIEQTGTAEPVDRRRRRRQESLDEILRIAVDVMAENGVAALSLSEVARRMGIRPPSIYKYFPSKLAVYDALFGRTSEHLRDLFREEAAAAEPGLPALSAGFVALGRYMMDNPVLAQLVNWRPVPGFEPSAEAFAPNREYVDEIRAVVATAVELGQLHPAAAEEKGLAVLSILATGAMTQQLANEPDATLETGRFTSLFPDLLELFQRAYQPGAQPIGGRR